MTNLKEKIKIEEGPSGKDIYWAFFKVRSEDEKEKTNVFVCTSAEYLGTEKITGDELKIHLEAWKEGLVKEIENTEEDLFKKNVYYITYSNNETHKVLLAFLKEKSVERGLWQAEINHKIIRK